MAGPDWTRWLLAVLLAAVNGTCLLRLTRDGDEPARHEDVGQAVAGIGMIAMLVSRLDAVSVAVWVAVFGAQATGFAVLVFRPGGHARVAVDHLMGSLAMMYMAVTGAGTGMRMGPSPLAAAFGMYFLLSAGRSVGRAVLAPGGAGTVMLRRPCVVEGARAVMGGGMAYLFLIG
jgi:hypothetical protein